jgi:CheY-like chemotaxis protein
MFPPFARGRAELHIFAVPAVFTGPEVAVCRILLIEDAPIVREPLARLLRDEGFQVVTAADGSDAMRELETQVVDLILLDVLMPHMNGVIFLEKLRHDPKLRDIAVIAVTGVADSGNLARLRELGVRTILHKVRFTFDLLLREIHQELRESVDSG